MPLHENLERRRWSKIKEYHESGVCHICECRSGKRSHDNFINDDGKEMIEEADGSSTRRSDNNDKSYEDATEAVAVAKVDAAASMLYCMCYGNCSWPYSLRVCKMCIDDDATTRRIRRCAICGVVACDEDCGAAELAEVTDLEEWNNAGCLECRGMESFSEMELFREKPHPHGIPRATRICMDCVSKVESASLTKYHFKCRYPKCKRKLIPSHVVESKRFSTQCPISFSLLPEDAMDSILDFLMCKDLFNFGLVCTFMLGKVERVSKDIVTQFHHEFPTGPVHSKRRMTVAEGRSEHSLRAPEDGGSWVGVLNLMEQLTRDTYVFKFHVSGGDGSAYMRYLRRRDKVQFRHVFFQKEGDDEAIEPHFERGEL